MTKTIKWLGAAAALLLGAGVLLMPSGALAESPPTPPARFTGTVKVDGQFVSAGTAIEAKVGSASCGVTQVFSSGGEARYVLDVAAEEPNSKPNCGKSGAKVTFFIGGKQAAEQGNWDNANLNVVNLTYVTPTPTPTPAPSATPAPTPRPPSTGQGTSGGDTGFAGLAVAILGVGVVAFGLGGVAAARRAK